MAASFDVSASADNAGPISLTGYTIYNGSFKILNNAIRPRTTDVPTCALVTSPSASGTLRMQISTANNSTIDFDSNGFVFCTTAGNGYIIRMRAATIQLFNLTAFVVGSSIVAATGRTYSTGDLFTAEFIINGASSTIKVYQNSISTVTPFIDQTSLTWASGMAEGVFATFENNNSAGIKSATNAVATLSTLTNPSVVGSTGNTGTTTGMGPITSMTFGASNKPCTITSATAGSFTYTMPSFAHDVDYPLMGAETFTVSDGTLTATLSIPVSTIAGDTSRVLASLDRSATSLGSDTTFNNGDEVHAPALGGGTLSAAGLFEDVPFGTYSGFWKRDTTSGLMHAFTVILLSDGDVIVISPSTTPITYSRVSMANYNVVLPTTPLGEAAQKVTKALKDIYCPGGSQDRSNSVMLAASLGRVAGTATELNDGTNTQLLTHSVHKTGRSGISNIRIGVAANYVSASEVVDAACTKQVRIELVGGDAITATFSGATTLSLSSGSAVVYCDPIPVYIPANTEFFIKVLTTVGDTSTALRCAQLLTIANKQKAIKGTDLAADFTSVGTPTGTAVNQLPPVSVLATLDSMQLSILYAGDGIAAGGGETTFELPHGQTGFLGRALVSVRGYDLPHTKSAHAGATIVGLASPALGYRRASLFANCSHYISALGMEDCYTATGYSIAQIKAAYQYVWKLAKVQGIHTLQTSILPNVSGIGSTQVPTANFEATGTSHRDELNTWFESIAGKGLLDEYIDTNAVVEDPDNLGTWLNGTDDTLDGVLPTSACHVRLATAVNEVLARLELEYLA